MVDVSPLIHNNISIVGNIRRLVSEAAEPVRGSLISTGSPGLFTNELFTGN